MEKNFNILKQIKPAEPSPWLFSKIQQRLETMQSELASPKQVRLAFMFIVAFLLLNLSVGLLNKPKANPGNELQRTENNNVLYP